MVPFTFVQMYFSDVEGEKHSVNVFLLKKNILILELNNKKNDKHILNSDLNRNILKQC